MVASQFLTSVWTVRRIWRQSKENGDVPHRKTGNCGVKKYQIDLLRLHEVPLHKRKNLRSLTFALGTSKDTLGRALKNGELRRHSNAIKPFLSEKNRLARLKFCLRMFDADSIPHNPTLRDMYDIVFIDEKWFNMTKKSENYYLTLEEEYPHRTCQSINFIPKVMFLGVVSRPRFDSNGHEVFSGKIGLFPFVTKEPAKRNSINRAAGTLETKPITSV